MARQRIAVPRESAAALASAADATMSDALRTFPRPASEPEQRGGSAQRDAASSLFADDEGDGEEAYSSGRRRDEGPASDHASGSGGAASSVVTTVMVRNIPAGYTQDMLLQVWPLDGKYDLLYLPVDAATNSHKGYAFINFTSEAYAREFQEMWRNRRLSHAGVSKRLNIIPSKVQGFGKNLHQLKKKRVGRVARGEWAPIVVVDGRLVDIRTAMDDREQSAQ